jgi:hypothetical protein
MSTTFDFHYNNAVKTLKDLREKLCEISKSNNKMSDSINKISEINNRSTLYKIPSYNIEKNSELHNLLLRIYKNTERIKLLKNEEDDNDTKVINDLHIKSYEAIYFSLIISIYWYGQFLKNYNKARKIELYYKKELFYFNDSKQIEYICEIAKACMILHGIEIEIEDEYYEDF